MFVFKKTKALSTVSKGSIFIKNKGILMSSLRRVSSVVNEKVEQFNDWSAAWWDPNGSMKHLHLVSPIQIAFISEQLGMKNPIKTAPHRHLAEYKIADVGCGVGMNSEGLALLGAEVTGLDPAKTTIEAARAHAAANPKLEGKLKYLVSTAEDHVLTHSGHYDAVVVFLVLEHIRNRQEFIDNCLVLLKVPNGSLFIGHCSRSLLWYSNTLWQQYVTGLIPKSMVVPYASFLTNKELAAMVNKGHSCDLKGQSNYYLTLDGQSCRKTVLDGFPVFSHFVKNDI